MDYPAPVSVGQYDPMKSGDVLDLYLDVAADLEEGETVASVDFEVRDSAGLVVEDVVGDHTETSSRSNFRLTAPAAGTYELAAVFTISDGQILTRIASLWVV